MDGAARVGRSKSGYTFTMRKLLFSAIVLSILSWGTPSVSATYADVACQRWQVCPKSGNSYGSNNSSRNSYGSNDLFGNSYSSNDLFGNSYGSNNSSRNSYGSNNSSRNSYGSGSYSATCNDGTLSKSKNRSGTCSWHGGVYDWNTP